MLIIIKPRSTPIHFPFHSHWLAICTNYFHTEPEVIRSPDSEHNHDNISSIIPWWYKLINLYFHLVLLLVGWPCSSIQDFNSLHPFHFLIQFHLSVISPHSSWGWVDIKEGYVYKDAHVFWGTWLMHEWLEVLYSMAVLSLSLPFTSLWYTDILSLAVQHRHDRSLFGLSQLLLSSNIRNSRTSGTQTKRSDDHFWLDLFRGPGMKKPRITPLLLCQWVFVICTCATPPRSATLLSFTRSNWERNLLSSFMAPDLVWNQHVTLLSCKPFGTSRAAAPS
jgi:hypothetical protein